MRHMDLMFAAGAMEKLVQVVFNESTANSLEKKSFLSSNGQKKCNIIYTKGILARCVSLGCGN